MPPAPGSAWWRAHGLSCFSPHRYTLSAQDLVMRARGVLKDRGWRISNDRLGSGDDISVYVIPLVHGNKLSWKRPRGLGGQGGESRAPLGRAGLRGAPAGFLVTPPPPSPRGAGCQSRCTWGRPRVSVSSLVTGLGTQQEPNRKATAECCVHFGSLSRPPRGCCLLGAHTSYFFSLE